MPSPFIVCFQINGDLSAECLASNRVVEELFPEFHSAVLRDHTSELNVRKLCQDANIRRGIFRDDPSDAHAHSFMAWYSAMLETPQEFQFWRRPK